MTAAKKKSSLPAPDGILPSASVAIPWTLEKLENLMVLMRAAGAIRVRLGDVFVQLAATQAEREQVQDVYDEGDEPKAYPDAMDDPATYPRGYKPTFPTRPGEPEVDE